MTTTVSQQSHPLMKPDYFFKIIMDHNLKEGKLMIPNKFVEKYGGDLPNTLFLKTPNGVQWEMNLEKRDGKIWFQKGWNEFAECHSLAHGHLLIFRCEKTPHFQVHIFDLSTLEIDYPSKTIEGKTASYNEGNKPSNDENLHYHRRGQKRKDNSSLELLQPYQLRRTKSVKKEALSHIHTNFKEKSKDIAYQVTALDRASSLKPCNPFFVVAICPSYVHRRAAQLNLPSKFCWRHFDLHKEQRIIINLHGLNGRVWPATFLIQKHKTKTRFRLSKGWKAFVKDNNLKVGDACTFELIDRTKLTFLVHIFRETDSSNCSTSQQSSQMRTVGQGQRKAMKTITATK